MEPPAHQPPSRPNASIYGLPSGDRGRFRGKGRRVDTYLEPGRQRVRLRPVPRESEPSEQRAAVRLIHGQFACSQNQRNEADVHATQHHTVV